MDSISNLDITELSFEEQSKILEQENRSDLAKFFLSLVLTIMTAPICLSIFNAGFKSLVSLIVLCSVIGVSFFLNWKFITKFKRTWRILVLLFINIFLNIGVIYLLGGEGNVLAFTVIFAGMPYLIVLIIAIVFYFKSEPS